MIQRSMKFYNCIAISISFPAAHLSAIREITPGIRKRFLSNLHPVNVTQTKFIPKWRTFKTKHTTSSNEKLNSSCFFQQIRKLQSNHSNLSQLFCQCLSYLRSRIPDFRSVISLTFIPKWKLFFLWHFQVSSIFFWWKRVSFTE